MAPGIGPLPEKDSSRRDDNLRWVGKALQIVGLVTLIAWAVSSYIIIFPR